MLFRICSENGSFLFAFGFQNSGLLFAFCTQDGFTAFAFCLHLLLHRVADGLRRENVLQLHTVDLDAPRVGSFVQDRAHLGVDHITAGQAFIQLQFTDDVTQRRRRKILNGNHRLFNTIGKELRIRHLEVDNRIDLHGNVIFCDNRLGWEVRHLLFQRDNLCYPLNKRNQKMDTDTPGCFVCTEALNHICFRLLDNADPCDNNNCQNKKNNQKNLHIYLPDPSRIFTIAFTPSILSTTTHASFGITD